MEIVLLVWVLVLATLWLVRLLTEELVAAVRGQPSPRIARRRAREELALDFGVPTVGQALSMRLARRIENPPDRKWLRRMRGLLAELAEDALAEARVRHHRNRQAAGARRRARQAGWKVRTGGPTSRRTPPPPEEDDTVMDTRPCRDCRTALVVPPDETCEACERATAPPPPPDPDQTPPEPTENDTAPPDRKAPAMASATHQIDADLRDPRHALAFATSCRGFNDALVGEFDILAAQVRRQGVGAGPLGEIRVLEDAARNYSTSNGRSVEVYAAHVVVQADLAGDEDLRDTARGYLDMSGEAGAPAQAGANTRTISAADCDTPAAAAGFMDGVAATYADLKTSVDQARSAHLEQGVSGKPIEFLDEQLDMAAGMAGKAAKAAERFRGHVQRIADTVGKDASLHGTQRGGWLDPARV